MMEEVTRKASPRTLGELQKFIDRARNAGAPDDARVAFTQDSPGEPGVSVSPQAITVEWAAVIVNETGFFRWTVISGVGITLWHVGGWTTLAAWMTSWVGYGVMSIILARRPRKDAR